MYKSYLLRKIRQLNEKEYRDFNSYKFNYRNETLDSLILRYNK